MKKEWWEQPVAKRTRLAVYAAEEVIGDDGEVWGLSQYETPFPVLLSAGQTIADGLAPVDRVLWAIELTAQQFADLVEFRQAKEAAMVAMSDVWQEF